ncbi:MAG: A/G-specific adenine glycosylase [Bacteroidales bacterium]|nr:A/G-specific adenine glycosylase [Bacteroidales bacterium]
MHISHQLINWYQEHHRNLPWRQTKDPYKIWLSEIILQQTRVDQGTGYYYRFIEEFPEIENLAKADEQTVLRLWQGLGYYSRARNLHKTAQAIVNEYNGKFPANFEHLLSLKGIGDYTASAIASHAFGIPKAVVDGNVFRFLARYFSISEPINTSKGQKYFKNLAEELLDKENPSLHNQAIMEFGALQCKPKNPDCKSCPFINNCQAFSHHKVDILPVKKRKTKVRNRFFNYFIVQNASKKILLKKRTAKDVWHNLYDFPMLETERQIAEKELLNGNQIEHLFDVKNYSIKEILPTQIHLLSHQKLHIRFIVIDFADYAVHADFKAYSSKEIGKLPLPRPIEQFLSRFLHK